MPSAGGPAVARVLERVTATARRHAMFDPGDFVLVAVSGGPDSTCLLHALHRLRRLFRIRLAVFHFDHRLRPGSPADADYVRRAARRLGLPFHLRRADSKPARGESVEAWAREVRMRAVSELWEELAPDGAIKLALGHTLDDQAETVLIAAIRGEGLEGLAGIAPRRQGWVRPLLEVRRAETAAFCRALGLRPREDPTNRDTRFLRNAIRLKAIPSLERLTGREVSTPLARTADLLREDADELSRRAIVVFARIRRRRRDGVALDAGRLAKLPRPIAARVAAVALSEFITPTREHIEAVLDLARGRPGRRRDLPAGLLAARDREYVRISRPSP